MNDQGHVQKEPTMEEILASIRRIIAEDGDETKPSMDLRTQRETPSVVSSARDQADDALELSDVVEEPRGRMNMQSTLPEQDDEEDEVGWDADGDLPIGDDEAAPLAASASEDDDIMELSDVIEEPVNLSERNSYQAPSNPYADEEPAYTRNPFAADPYANENRAEPQTFGYERSEEREERYASRSEPSYPSSAYEDAEEPAPSRYEPQTRYGAERESAPVSSGYHTSSSAMTEKSMGLISEKTEQAAMAAFGLLSNTLIARPGEGKTVEDLIKEMLDPLLRQWLDQNLPGVVERLVQEEIERVARRSR